MIGKNDAAYYRARRAMLRQQPAESNDPLRVYGDYAEAPHFVAAGKELAAMMNRVPNLPWPHSLFSATMA